MGRPAGWMKQLTGREAMRSPRAPSHRREVWRQFWVQIATGITSEKAAEAVGVSQAIGTRWFRRRGGMPLEMTKPVCGRYLSFAEREEMGLLRAQHVGVREIARRIGRSPSTVSRELHRNAATRGGKLVYRAPVAQWKSELVAKRPKPAKLATNPRLREYVQDHLEGRSTMNVGARSPDLDKHRSSVATSHIAVTANGSMAGHRSRLPTASGLTSLMIRPCAFPMKPSTKRSTFKAGAPSNVRWSVTCALGVLCARHAPDPRPKAGPMSVTR